MFDGDTKVDKLLDSHGWKGFGIYFFLCQLAYKFDGYFYRWCFDDSATTARRMGAGITSATVKETVQTCLQIGLFDNRTFEEWGVLTSRGIQKRYCAAIKERRSKVVISEYWLLTDSETDGIVKGLVKCAKNSNSPPANGNSPPANGDLPPANDHKSKEKESKGKESKEEERRGDRKTSNTSGYKSPASSLSSMSPAMEFFLNRINPTASNISLGELLDFERDLGSAVCIRAMILAIDAQKSTWPYIKGILQQKQRMGIRSLEAWDASEAAFQERKNREKAGKGRREEPRKSWEELAKEMEAENG